MRPKKKYLGGYGIVVLASVGRWRRFRRASADQLKQKKATRKKRDAVPRVRRRVVKNIVRDEEQEQPEVVEIKADFFVQLGRTLRTVERESWERRLSALPIVQQLVAS